MTDLIEMEKKLLALQSVVLDLKNDVIDLKRENFNFKQEIWKLKSERSVLEDKVKKLEKEQEGIETEIGHLKKLRSLFNHMVVKAHGLTVKQTAGHKQQVDNKETTLAIPTPVEPTAMIKPSIFHARIRPSQELDLGHYTLIDVCEKVLFDDEGWFDHQACCMLPRRDCRVALAWRLSQDGLGEIRAYFKSDAFVGRDFLGRTTYDHDICQGVRLWEFKKGERTWMEVNLSRGDAKVYWCVFMAWVVG